MGNNEKVIKLIQEFSNDAVELMVVYDGKFLRQFMLGKDEANFDSDKLFKDSALNFEFMEVHRSLISNNGDVVFTIDIDFHDDRLIEGLRKSLNVAREIEQIFPGQFLWAFSGRCVHAHSYIKYSKENEAIITRYGKVFNFCKAILHFLKTQYRIDAGDTAPFHYKGTIKSMGSYHKKTGLYKIPITLDMTEKEIIQQSQTLSGFNENWEIPTMDVVEMRRIVPIYTPTFQKTYEERTDENKHPVNMAVYPSAIKALMATPNKGNKLRFDLLRYFFALHKKADVLDLMQTILTPTEFRHMVKEKQFDHVYNRNYPPLTKAYIETTYKIPCDVPNPTILNWGDEE